MTDILAPQALTALSEEETMVRDAVADFAATEIAPHVHEMDAAAKFRPDIIPKFFEMGLMGIEVPTCTTPSSTTACCAGGPIPRMRSSSRG
jgi:alkylation response protein AidB-like acyl-CoA dehydrogenase